ncbi:diaminopimelate decarboxylase [Synechococcus sp. PCC 6312]|uniref:diaminopimelate decarboxylase n=1 Tax=Synechococcus sp. (strain ATCC 27167 / PCC 6312) TaxID=195253 RepID=UPI00029F3358|nr:diaminopimelate decarboxylase [Synechococcus sp. PCC 6312]AFY60558.1 diaminopimelate decarboxylase [Synechococcus sp. PCC 6312]
MTPATLATQSLSAFPDLSQAPTNQQLLPLTAETNAQGHLEVGGCDLVELVAQFGSPLYVLDEETFRRACRDYVQGLHDHYPGESLVLYASKAWNCLATCALASRAGLGIDVASGGELYTALMAGANPETIYFHGNNKSLQELAQALEMGCTVVADNWLELTRLAELAAHQSPDQPKPRVMLRLTPGIECHTHDYIRTGQLDSKFGFDPQALPDLFTFALEHPQIDWVGVHAHIGSQIFELQPHQDLANTLAAWFSKAARLGLNFQEFNVGGGLGMRYVEADNPPSIRQWTKWVANSVIQACRSENIPLPKLICEPGRSIAGPSTVTAYTIGTRKDIPGIRTYIAVDGGMSDNPRPITYQAQYTAVLGNRILETPDTTVTVAGKHCESGDILLKDIQLPNPQPGDTLVVFGTGAYNYSMASNYNRLTRPAAVLVKEGNATVILKRETYADLLRQDVLPSGLA